MDSIQLMRKRAKVRIEEAKERFIETTEGKVDIKTFHEYACSNCIEEENCEQAWHKDNFGIDLSDGCVVEKWKDISQEY